MIDEDWSHPPVPAGPAHEVRVVAIVPLPDDVGGRGEVLALSAFGTVKLPVVELRPGESIHRAANRAVLQLAGVGATPERLLYVVEQAGKALTLCLLCSLADENEPEERPGVRFVPVVGNDSEFEPPAVRELLLEDGPGGFVRPTAFVTVGFDEQGNQRTHVSW